MGLGLLPMATRFGPEKVTTCVSARAAAAGFLAEASGTELTAYEIHMGVTARTDGGSPAFEILSRNGDTCAVADGASGAGGAVVGTMLHGLLENDAVCAALLGNLRGRRGNPGGRTPPPAREGQGVRAARRSASFDRLAQAVAGGIDWALLTRIAQVELPLPRFDGVEA
jgi:adenosylcobyric acid synthase